MNFKNALYLTAFLLIISLFTCNTCQRGKIAKLEEQLKGQPVKTVTKRDTLWKSVAVDVPVYVPKPYAIIHEKVSVDSFVEFDHLPVDTAAILKDYTAKVYYRDSFSTQYGKYFISDTVSRNRLAGRHITGTENVPVITNTITNTVAGKKRNQVFLGLQFQGQPTDYVQAFGPSLMFVSKQGQGVELGALWDKQRGVVYQGSLKFKLSFKK